MNAGYIYIWSSPFHRFNTFRASVPYNYELKNTSACEILMAEEQSSKKQMDMDTNSNH